MLTGEFNSHEIWKHNQLNDAFLWALNHIRLVFTSFKITTCNSKHSARCTMHWIYFRRKLIKVLVSRDVWFECIVQCVAKWGIFNAIKISNEEKRTNTNEWTRPTAVTEHLHKENCKWFGHTLKLINYSIAGLHFKHFVKYLTSWPNRIILYAQVSA